MLIGAFGYTSAVPYKAVGQVRQTRHAHYIDKGFDGGQSYGGGYASNHDTGHNRGFQFGSGHSSVLHDNGGYESFNVGHGQYSREEQTSSAHDSGHSTGFQHTEAYHNNNRHGSIVHGSRGYDSGHSKGFQHSSGYRDGHSQAYHGSGGHHHTDNSNGFVHVHSGKGCNLQGGGGGHDTGRGNTIGFTPRSDHGSGGHHSSHSKGFH